MIYQCDIIEMVADFEKMDAEIEKKVVREENGRILSLMAKLLSSDWLIGFTLSMTSLFLSTKKKFTIPMLYNPQSDAIYYGLFVVHYFQIIGIGTISHGELNNSVNKFEASKKKRFVEFYKKLLSGIFAEIICNAN